MSISEAINKMENEGYKITKHGNIYQWQYGKESSTLTEKELINFAKYL